MPRLREMPANLLKKPLDRDMAGPGEPVVVNKIGGKGHGKKMRNGEGIQKSGFGMKGGSQIQGIKD
jgi:hypothetical protein